MDAFEPEKGCFIYYRNGKKLLDLLSANKEEKLPIKVIARQTAWLSDWVKTYFRILRKFFLLNMLFYICSLF